MSNANLELPSGGQVPTLKGLPPIIVSQEELRFVLAPLVATDKWAQNTIGDLWRVGAPTPESVMGTPNERRIIFPGQLAKWLADILERRGLSLDVAAQIYAGLRRLST